MHIHIHTPHAVEVAFRIFVVMKTFPRQATLTLMLCSLNEKQKKNKNENIRK